MNVIRSNWASIVKSGLQGRLRAAIFWGGFATIVGRGLPLLSMMIAARQLGASEFGKLALLVSSCLAFEVFVSAGLSVTSTKLVADFARTNVNRAGQVIDFVSIVSLVAALAIASLIVLLAPFLANNVMANPGLEEQVRWSALLVCLLAFSVVQQGVLLGMEAFKSQATIEVVGGFTILLLVSWGTAEFGVNGGLGGLIGGHFVRCSVQFAAISRELSLRGIPRYWRFPKSEASIFWMFSVPSMANSFLWGPVTWFAITIVVRQPNGAAEVGLFSAANQWFSLLLFLPTILNQTIFPIMTERFNAGEEKAAWKVFSAKSMVILLVMLPLTGLVAASAEWIMGRYGAEYEGAGFVLVLVAISALVAAPQGPMGNVLLSHSKPWQWFNTGLVWAGVLLSTVFIGREYGALALASGFLIAYGVRGILAVLCVVRIWNKRPCEAT